MSDVHSPDAHLPFVLGIIGDSGSGKTTVARGVRQLIGEARVTPLELDDYLRLTRAERLDEGVTSLHPRVHDLALMQEHLMLLRRGRPVRHRRYDHSDGTFGPVRVVAPGEVVLVRGLLGFPTPSLRAAYDLAVFLVPEAELLFRWKLRRDVKTRGYSEADVLKYIARHLLDSKEYILPQAEQADLVVRYEVPEWDAPDSQVHAVLTLRRAAAAALRDNGGLSHLSTGVEVEAGDDETTVRVAPSLPTGELERWARGLFPETFDAEQLGQYTDDAGETVRSPVLGFTEVFIAYLTQKMRRTGERLAPQPADAVA